MKKSPQLQKILLSIMKISLLQLFIAVIFASVSLAHEATAQEILNRKVSLKIENKAIKTILSDIEKTANVRFTYRPKLISTEKNISFKAENERLSDVLERLLKPMKITWDVVGDQIILKKIIENNAIPTLTPTSIAEPQTVIKEVTVTGTVKDEKGEALPGVNILVKGTSKGTSTDGNGAYKLILSDEKSTLSFSSVGYLTQEVYVGNQSIINVTLIANDNTLSEVVVVGYGTQERRDVTGRFNC